MNGISRASGMTSMHTNCGMKGMHEDTTKKTAANQVQKVDTTTKKEDMPINCGMKGMHDNSTNSNKNNAQNTLGSKIDMKA